MAERYVMLTALGRLMGMDKSSVGLRAKRLGLNVVTIMNPQTGHTGRAILAEDAKAIIDSEKRTYEVVRPEDIIGEERKS